MFKTIKDLEVDGKTILLRVDFNVPFDAVGRVLDDFRLQAAWPTVQYLLARRCKIVLLSHFSEDAGFGQGAPLNPEKMALLVGRLFGQPLRLAPEISGPAVGAAVAGLKEGEMILLPNLRDDPGEKQNDQTFAHKLAKLGDVFINDAFSVCHRAHASVATLPTLLPSAAGLLVQKEVAALQQVGQKIASATLVLGGAKISTKISLIGKFLNEAQNVLVGGALANNLLEFEGVAVGQSLVEKNLTPGLVEKIDIQSPKLHLPVDALVADDTAGKNIQTKTIANIETAQLILDIGPETTTLFTDIIKKAAVVVWNGPLGFFENESFFGGTRQVAQAVARAPFSVIGGGETILCARQAAGLGKFTHVSTGGGAMMDFLAGEKLPGLAVLGL